MSRHDRSHAHRVEGNEKRLYSALGLTALFMVIGNLHGPLTHDHDADDHHH